MNVQREKLDDKYDNSNVLANTTDTKTSNESSLKLTTREKIMGVVIVLLVTVLLFFIGHSIIKNKHKLFGGFNFESVCKSKNKTDPLPYKAAAATTKKWDAVSKNAFRRVMHNKSYVTSYSNDIKYEPTINGFTENGNMIDVDFNEALINRLHMPDVFRPDDIYEIMLDELDPDNVTKIRDVVRRLILICEYDEKGQFHEDNRDLHYISKNLEYNNMVVDNKSGIAFIILRIAFPQIRTDMLNNKIEIVSAFILNHLLEISLALAFGGYILIKLTKNELSGSPEECMQDMVILDHEYVKRNLVNQYINNETDLNVIYKAILENKDKSIYQAVKIPPAVVMNKEELSHPLPVQQLITRSLETQPIITLPQSPFPLVEPELIRLDATEPTPPTPPKSVERFLVQPRPVEPLTKLPTLNLPSMRSRNSVSLQQTVTTLIESTSGRITTETFTGGSNEPLPYQILRKEDCFSDEGYKILSNDFKLLSKMLIDTYAIGWSGCQCTYCNDIYISRDYFRVEDGEKIYRYQTKPANLWMFERATNFKTFYNATASEIRSITKLYPMVIPTFEIIFNHTIHSRTAYGMRDRAEGMGYFGFFTISIFDYRLYVNNEPDDHDYDRKTNSPNAFRRDLYCLFWTMLSNPAIPYFNRVIALNNAVEFCLAIYENWFLVYDTYTEFNAIEPMFHASDDFITRYQIKEIFEPLKDFIVPGIYRRLFDNPKRVMKIEDVMQLSVDKLCGMAALMEVLPEDESFNISDYNEFDRKVKEVCERIFTDSYIVVNEEELECEYNTIRESMMRYDGDPFKCVTLDTDLRNKIRALPMLKYKQMLTEDKERSKTNIDFY